jgi:hypothetical protein
MDPCTSVDLPHCGTVTLCTLNLQAGAVTHDSRQAHGTACGPGHEPHDLPVRRHGRVASGAQKPAAREAGAAPLPMRAGCWHRAWHGGRSMLAATTPCLAPSLTRTRRLPCLLPAGEATLPAGRLRSSLLLEAVGISSELNTPRCPLSGPIVGPIPWCMCHASVHWQP